jgi:hypothetical protein
MMMMMTMAVVVVVIPKDGFDLTVVRKSKPTLDSMLDDCS